ncbi:phage scaffolding protein [Paenibacillus chondroitinus]|uniref:Phage scaffolding protein n=1 Tax=Paenibacillus chondroitinus TaxID=59842 RepID=A0ABU6D657_9BACL|nr:MULTISPECIES: phage scaffolding protein [Paenibacillus]MCY9658127.1 phage scaffolding protein [Paenibacillus anseongense]MEB4793211.1 phage scaffolding protein [Paenibacillus chondroitinus]
MEWLKQLLKQRGLSDEQITAIVEGVETNYRGWVPEHRFKEVNDAKKTAEDTLKERDKQLEALSKSAGDNNVLQDQIKQLQADNKTASDKYEADLKELRVTTAIKMALSGKVHDPEMVIGLLDKNKVELDDTGNLKSGLEEQVKALQTSKAFLFVPEKSNQQQFKGMAPADGRDKGGGGGEDQNNIGKRLAEQVAKQGEVLDKARESYFQ